MSLLVKVNFVNKHLSDNCRSSELNPFVFHFLLPPFYRILPPLYRIDCVDYSFVLICELIQMYIRSTFQC